MGTKNRIFLGIITTIILHHHRNQFKKSIYMSKRVESKIKVKHQDTFIYTSNDNFINLLKNTIASCSYDNKNHTINFIAVHNNKYILYSLKQEKYHTTCTTIFTLRPDTLKRYYKQNNLKLFKMT